MELMILIMKFGIQHNVMGDWVIMQLKLCLCSQAEHLQDHHSERVQAEYQYIVPLVLSWSLKVLVNIIKLLYVHVCCIYVLYFYMFNLQCYIKSISLSDADSSVICLSAFWSDSKEDFFSLRWVTRTDSLPCNFLVFISKLSECKQVELSSAFLACFVNYLVSINDTVLLHFQLNFIFTITRS